MAPPANDNFANAIALSTTLPGSRIGDTSFDSTEESGEPEVFHSGTTNIEQGVWYTFTPGHTGWYRFYIPYATLTYHGTHSASSGEIRIFLFGTSTTSLATATAANQLAQDVGFPVGSGWSSPHDITVVAQLTSGVTYYIKVGSGFGTTSNRSTCDFDLYWDELTATDNDNFASPHTISGPSGTDDFHMVGSTVETSEPPSYYWNGEPQTQGTVWFDWTCPSTGDYVFRVEATDDSVGTSMPNIDLAVWTGSSLGSLTKICRNWAGTKNNEGRPRSPATAVGFHATSGTHYKIQASGYPPTENNLRLSWRTNTVTGDSTAAAASFPDGRTDNYGNDDSEPPPSASTILATHDGWTFLDTPAIGAVKWYKAVYSASQTISIKGRQWDDVTETTSALPANNIGLIAYKGANYGSLSVAKISGTSVDACMMLITAFLDDSTNYKNRLATLPYSGHSEGNEELLIDVSPGDTLWVCLFGLYDDASWADSFTDSKDAHQFDIDLHIPTAAPGNDTWAAVWGSSNIAYRLNRDQYDGGFAVGLYANERTGSTIGATADVGEASRAGFAATRSVWYYWYPPNTDDTFRFWVESTEDCVLGVYDVAGPGSALGALLAEDDDSGTGNWPQIDLDIAALWDGGSVGRDWTGNAFAIVVDMKTEGAFTIKYEKIWSGTPPANDDFASATVISSIPYTASGTTVGATAETQEHVAEEFSFGPQDTVWYKYVATADGQLRVRATCDTNLDDAYVYVDVWRGTTLAGLVRAAEPAPVYPKGYFDHFTTPAALAAAALTINVVNGQTYYIRVQTESGGSEDFTIYVDVDGIYVDIQPSGSDEVHGTLLDAATVPLRFGVSSVEDFHAATAIDAATVVVDLVAAGSDFKAFQYSDSGTAYVDMTAITEHECIFHLEPSWVFGGIRKWGYNGSKKRWVLSDTERRWAWVEGEGQPQIC